MLELKRLLEIAKEQLKDAGIEEYENDSVLLMEYCFDMNKTDLFMNRDREMDEDRCTAYLELVDRRREREPLQYITGVQYFMGIEFKVTPDVLIPRQDTEKLVTNAQLLIESNVTKKTAKKDARYIYEWLPGRKNWKVLDLCCGSGAIGISLAKLCGNIKKVTMSDISPAATALAKVNAERTGVSKKVDIITGDMFAPLKAKAKFDMITVNPPYIATPVLETLAPEVKDYEPAIALDGGPDGLDFYRRLIPELSGRLEKNGAVLLEIGHDQGKAVTELIEGTESFAGTEIVKDYGGNDRIVIAVKK